MFSKLLIKQLRQRSSSIMVLQVPAAFTQARGFRVSITRGDKLAPKQVQNREWNRALSEAEHIVGYSSSWLLTNEIVKVALHLRKLIGSGHPLLKTVRHLLYNEKNTMQAWGLIVLLISKAAGHEPTILNTDQNKRAGVLHSQRILAKITEMIRICHLMHSSLGNLQRFATAAQNTANYDQMIVGNKICLLTGDYLLGHSLADLANLRNQEISELILSAVRDFSEAEFIGDRDQQNKPLPFKPGTVYPQSTKPFVDDFTGGDALLPLNVGATIGNPEKEWEVRHILNAGSLLGKSCQGSLKLAGRSEELQKLGYLFGKHLSLAWQACLDAEPFQGRTLPLDCTFSLISAPVLFHLEQDPSLYDEIEKGRVSIENIISYENIHQAILKGSGLERTKKLQQKHTTAAMHVLEKFPPTDARTALENIILGMRDM